MRAPVRFATRLVLALALLAGAAGLATPASAAVLVSNINQAEDTAVLLSIVDLAQEFTTGSNTQGYDLTSIEVRFGTEAPSGLSVKLMTGVSASSAGTEVATLTNPSSLGTGNLTFTAPSGTILSASTTYWVVLEGTSGGVVGTTSDTEDTGGAAGWSVADTRRVRLQAETSGFEISHTNALMIRVNGTARTTAPPTGPTITIAAGTSPVTEGTAATFTVTANPAPSSDLTVNLSVSESANGDYVAAGNEGAKTVTISSGNTSATYSVATEDDTTDEPNGSVTVQVSSGTGYTVGTTSSATVNVNDNDDPPATTPTITIAAGTSPVTEGTAATFTVTANPAPSANLTVNLSVSEASGSDYVAAGNEGAKTVTISAGNTSATYSVATVDDSTDEPNGSVTVQVSSGTGYTVGTASSATVNVNDNDAAAVAPTVTEVAITSDPGADGAYQANDKIQVTVTFDAAVTVSGGPPRVIMHFQGEGVSTQRNKQAAYESGSGTNQLVFAYTVVAADDSGTVGIGLPANRLELNGGTIQAGSTDAILTYAAVAHDTNHHVRGATAQDTTAPTLATPPPAPAVVSGATLTLRISENLDGGSVPAPAAFTVTVNGQRRNVADGGVAIANDRVTLTLESAVIDADTVMVAYDKPVENPLQDFRAGNDMASFGATAVTNNTPGVAPTVTGATVSGTRLVITFSENLDENSEPAAAAFAVTGRTVTAVDVSGNTVTLTLDSAAGAGTVTVGYNKPATNLLRDRASTPNEVASFSGQNVVVATVFQSAVTTADGMSVVITFTQLIQQVGLVADYTVEVDGVPRTPTNVSGGAGRARLQMNPPIEAGQTVRVTYRPGGGARLTDTNGNAVEGFTRQPVSNRVPAAVSGAPTVNRARLVIAFNAALGAGPAPVPGDFAVTVAGEARDVAAGGVAVSGRNLILTLDSAVAPGQAVTVRYTGTALTDAEGNTVAAFGPRDVTNNTPRPRPPPPPPSSGGGFTPTPRDTAPSFGGATVAALTLIEGEAMPPVSLPAASGGNGRLSYSLASDPAGLAGLSFDPAARRLSGTPAAAGDYVFTWRADDADANRRDTDAAVLRFAVTVESLLDRAVKRALRRTLAAVGTRTLTGALANIGARFADGAPGTGVTLAGRSLPLGTSAAAVRAGLERACPAEVYGRGGYGRFAGCGPARGISTGELMRASAFSWTSAPADGGDSPAPLWAVWGRGDFGSFEGRPDPGSHYKGDTRTGWLGFDMRRGPWVAGLALSHGRSEADYGVEAGGEPGRGRLETSLTALYPYGRWTFANGVEVRGVLGAGTGEARHRLEGDERETSDLTMRMASVGLRRALVPAGGFDLAVRADASLVQMEVDDGPEFISGVSADGWRARLGLEATRRIALGGGAALTPFLEAAARRDGGDGVTGSGIEIAGGARYTAPRLQVEVRGRWLAAHSGEGVRERGVSVTARFGPGAEGRGLSFALRPRWGAPADGAEALWRDEMPRLPGGTAEAALDARVGYGFAWDSRGLLTPFAETSAGGADRRLRLGTRFKAARADLQMELAGERRESEGARKPVHGVRLDVRLGF